MCAWILKEKLQEDPDSDVAQKKSLGTKQGPGLVGTVNFVTINRSGDDIYRLPAVSWHSGNSYSIEYTVAGYSYC